MTKEETRLAADCNRKAYWKRWEPYLSERQPLRGSQKSKVKSQWRTVQKLNSSNLWNGKLNY